MGIEEEKKRIIRSDNDENNSNNERKKGTIMGVEKKVRKGMWRRRNN